MHACNCVSKCMGVYIHIFNAVVSFMRVPIHVHTDWQNRLRTAFTEGGGGGLRTLGASLITSLKLVSPVWDMDPAYGLW